MNFLGAARGWGDPKFQLPRPGRGRASGHPSELRVDAGRHLAVPSLPRRVARLDQGPGETKQMQRRARLRSDLRLALPSGIEISAGTQQQAEKQGREPLDMQTVPFRAGQSMSVL